ncbi:fatty acid desaturase family protein [Kibdelosporangium phytohabitans]|uniref:Fatty acid desaturase n=1 Tax=Kibdelosporangium phytohabitans TaxID=860235 RepID=A0A0N9HTR8_9PSEU|nr:fatty acid desaturase [Kibdelosporangium phytohabitans]ALG08364.1 fatty acid desaturase [Kibdelosporangium phytohabitans]MBE1470591.1 fatty acid desaturase [Kibdelosporangium phytohabitans]
MRIWKHSPRDGILLAFSVVQLAVMIWLAAGWDEASVAWRVIGFVVIAVMTAYNVIVVSHLFTHVPWFASARLNAVASLLNSVDIGQSVQAYHLTHVRNHHRFNNDPIGPDGTTRDKSSTYKDGENGEHTPLLRYVFQGAAESMLDRAKDLYAVTRLWRVGAHEQNLLTLAASREPKRTRELRQVQADRAAHCLALAGFAVISWQWTLFCYIPAFFVALAMVNVQNYYRHYGADPSNRAADAVSHYSRLYNLVAFNDGYHQEHHLSPATHWSKLPTVRDRREDELEAQPRIVSPVPAMLGFLHRDRPLLHKDKTTRSPG